MEISSNAVRLEMGLRFLTKVPDIFKEIRFNMFSNAVNSAISVFCRLSFLRFVSVDNGRSVRTEKSMCMYKEAMRHCIWL